jgi:hypothetical protein
MGWCCGAIALDVLAYPVVWIVAPIHGSIIDGATNQPLRGTTIAATWQLEFLANTGVLDVAQTQSNASGQFALGGWRLRWHLRPGHVSDHEPAIWVFRQGYAPYRASNQCCGYIPSRILVRMPDQRIRLERAPLSDIEYGQEIDGWTQRLAGTLALTPACAWSRLDEILRQTQIAQDTLRAKNIASGPDLSRVSASCTRQNHLAG